MQRHVENKMGEGLDKSEEQLEFYEYNPYNTSKERTKEILKTLNGNVVVLSGTQRRREYEELLVCDKDAKVPSCTKWETPKHEVLQWGYGTRFAGRDGGRFSNRYAGVSIAIHKRLDPKRSVRMLISPPESLQGRAGACRIKWRCWDLWICAVYFPIESKYLHEQRAAKE